MDNLKTFIAETFPGLVIKTFAKMGEGKAGEIYLVNNETVFKVPLSSDESDSDLVLEHETLCALQGKMKIAVPKPLYIGKLPDGRMVLGESLVPGVQFTYDMYDAMTQNEKDEIFRQMGDIFHQLHTADIPRVTNAPVYDVASSLEYFTEHYTDIVKKELSSAEQARIEEIYQNFITTTRGVTLPSVLCHGDVHFQNLNINPATKSICGLLDFGIVCYHDPVNDMRYFWPRDVERMLVKYPSNLGEGAGARHLFYCICNKIEETHEKLLDGGLSDSVYWLKQIIYQEPL
jgi:hypothetical protein